MGRGTQEHDPTTDQFATVMGRRRGARRELDVSQREEIVKAIRERGSAAQRLQVEVEELQAKSPATATDVGIALSAWKELVADFESVDSEGGPEETSRCLILCRPLGSSISAILAQETETSLEDLRRRAYEELMKDKPPAHGGEALPIYPSLADEIEATLRNEISARLQGKRVDEPFDIRLAQGVARREYEELLSLELDTAIGGGPTQALARRIVGAFDPEAGKDVSLIEDLSARPWNDAIFSWLENDHAIGIEGLGERLLSPDRGLDERVLGVVRIP